MIKKFEAHSKYEENIEIIKEDFVELLDEGATISTFTYYCRIQINVPEVMTKKENITKKHKTRL